MTVHSALALGFVVGLLVCFGFAIALLVRFVASDTEGFRKWLDSLDLRSDP